MYDRWACKKVSGSAVGSAAAALCNLAGRSYSGFFAVGRSLSVLAPLWLLRPLSVAIAWKYSCFSQFTDLLVLGRSG